MAAGNVSSNIGVGGGISTVTSLPSSPSDGDFVRLKRPKINDSPEVGTKTRTALWQYDGTASQWKIRSTGGDWWPYETWDSGKVRSEWWTFFQGDGSLLNVNTNKNRVELSFSSSPGTNLTEAFHSRRIDLDTDVFFDFSLGAGGQPGTGGYFTIGWFGDMDAGGGSKIADAFRSKLQANTNNYDRKYAKSDKDSGGSRVEESVNSISTDTYYRTSLQVGRYGGCRYREWHEDGTQREDVGSSLPANYYSDGVIGFYFDASSDVSVSSTMWAGPVWVRS